ncbi:MAG: HlyD family efflux transporter periplasmic adaptor subunit [Planctomycetota bacterium]
MRAVRAKILSRREPTWSDFPALDLVRTGRLVRIAGRVTLLLLVASVLGMLLLPWQQTSSGTGVVVALDPQQRPQAVKSIVKGVVSKVKEGLREGSYVKQGEVLIELVPAAEGGIQQLELQIAAVQLKVDLANDRIQYAKEQVELQKSAGKLLAESLQKELDAAEQVVTQAEKEAEATNAELLDKENQLRIAEEVIQEGIISQRDLVSKRQAAEMTRQKYKKAQSYIDESKDKLESKRKEVKAKEEEIEIKNRDAANKLLGERTKLQTDTKELSELTVKLQEMSNLKVRAPKNGYIQQWYGLEGSDTVKEGATLFVVVPDADELSVELTINGNDMPLVHEGDMVRLQFEGWPAVQFVGWPSVAIGTFGGRVNRVFPTDDGKGNFRVLVTADVHREQDIDWPNDNYLRQGVRANGWVLLNRVSLGYEVWRQLNGFPPSLPDAKKEKVDKVKLPKA